MISRLIVSFMGASVIGHGLMLLLSIAKWRNLLNSQLLVYVGDEQTPLDLLNLLLEGTDLDPDEWLTRHKSIPAFPRRNADRRSFGSKKILLEEFVDTYQIQRIWNSYVLTSNAHLVCWSWYSEKDPFVWTLLVYTYSKILDLTITPILSCLPWRGLESYTGFCFQSTGTLLQGSPRGHASVQRSSWMFSSNVPDPSILLMTGPFHLSGPIKNLSSKSCCGHTSQEGAE